MAQLQAQTSGFQVAVLRFAIHHDAENHSSFMVTQKINKGGSDAAGWDKRMR